MEGELLEDLESVPIAEGHPFIQAAKPGGDLQLLLHLVSPLAERNAVRLAVLPSLQKDLRVRMERHLIVQRIGSAKEGHGEVPQRRRTRGIAKDSLHVLPERLHQGSSLEALDYRISVEQVSFGTSAKKPQQKRIQVHGCAGQHRHHLQPNIPALIVLSDHPLQSLDPDSAMEIRGVVLRNMDKLMRQSGLLSVQRGSIGLVFIPLEQEVEQPVIRISRAGRGQINEKLGFGIRVADDADLGAKLIPRHRELRHMFIQEGVEGLRPLPGVVIPKDQTMALEHPLETVVNSFHGVV